MFSAFKQFALDGELELVHRTQQDRVELLLGSLRRAFVLTLQIDEYRQLILEDRARTADGFFRIDRAVRFDVENQLVEIRALFDARAFHRIRDTADRAE